jgi:hypothetical protein
MSERRFSLSIDWLAVIVAVVCVALVKLNIVPHIGW